jgi:hypothetical protein
MGLKAKQSMVLKAKQSMGLKAIYGAEGNRKLRSGHKIVLCEAEGTDIL